MMNERNSRAQSVTGKQGLDGQPRCEEASRPSSEWPSDLSKDRRAWELAKIALGADADAQALVQRAQEIKETL